MHHYTFNTGHSPQFPRGEVRDDVIETCRPWCFVRHSSREEMRDDVIETCRPWCAHGCHDLDAKSLHEAFRHGGGPMLVPGWRLRSTQGERGSLLFTLHRGEEPIVTCGVAPDKTAADEVWPVLQGMYLDLFDRGQQCIATFERMYLQTADWELANKPESTPWLAVVLVAMSNVYVTESWIADFERCIAWAWLDESGLGVDELDRATLDGTSR